MASIELSELKLAVKREAEAGATAIASPHAEQHHDAKRPFNANYFTVFAVLFQVALIVLYGTCTKFDSSISPQNAPSASTAPLTPGGPALGVQYAMFQDTHVMMAIGFGFLYTLFRRYAWSGVSWNYLILAFALQWAVLLNGFWERVIEKAEHGAGFSTIPLTLGSFIRSDYSAATVLITYGAVIGRVSPMQLTAITVWEIIWSTANEAVGTLKLGTSDPGGAMYIHTFGAAFGLALSWVLGDKAFRPSRPDQAASVTTSRTNGTLAMIGTLFLFCFWPSFNAGMTQGAEQHRIVINTLLSIAGSVVGTFAASKAIFGGARFDMEHIQNATVSGGVAIGTACSMLVNPWGAMLTGLVTGVVVTYGFTYATPFLRSRLHISDTCGIFNLHFTSGVIGGIAGAIAAAGVTIGSSETDWSLASAQESFPGRWLHGNERSAVVQGGYQMAVTVISVVFGAVAGLVGGYIIRLPIFEPKDGSFYEDSGEWNVPDDEEKALEETVKRIIAAVNASPSSSPAKASLIPTAPLAADAPTVATAASTEAVAVRVDGAVAGAAVPKPETVSAPASGHASPVMAPAQAPVADAPVLSVAAQ